MHSLVYLTLLRLALGAAVPSSADSDQTHIVRFRKGTDVSVRSKILRELGDENNHIDYDNVFLGFSKSMNQTEVELVRKYPDVGLLTKAVVPVDGVF